MIHFKSVTSVCLNVWKQNIIILSWMGELWPDDPTHSRSEPPNSLKLNIFRLIRPSARRKCRFLLPSAPIDIFSFTVLKDQVWRRRRKESYRLHLLIVCIRWRVSVCFCRSLAQFIILSLKAKAKRNAWQQPRTIMDGFHSRDEGPCGKRNYLHQLPEDCFISTYQGWRFLRLVHQIWRIWRHVKTVEGQNNWMWSTSTSLFGKCFVIMQGFNPAPTKQIKLHKENEWRAMECIAWAHKTCLL